ncbi:MAG: ATP-grasp domain-containing protein [Clostridia bacterium]|nr:ATP-grasp domain-containing protein [Clostridia bacterium]
MTMLKINKIRFWYNSLYALTSEVSIEIASGKVIYKTNFKDEQSVSQSVRLFGKLPYYESFFLVAQDKAQRFGKYAEKVLLWKPYYGVGRCIDGFYWNLSVELEDGSKKEFVGENGEPDDFDEFVMRFERLIKKQLSYTNRYAMKHYIESGRFFGEDGNVIVLLPSDYFDVRIVEPDFASEYEAVCRIPQFKVLFYNYDAFVSGESLQIYPNDYYTGDCIYRGWMLNPEQYRVLYDSLHEKGISLINTPNEYDACHLHPQATQHDIRPYTPYSMVFIEGEKINWDIVNNRFKKFMIKDYVKSVKDTGFPEFFETPVKAKEMELRISEFIDLRGKLFTQGIVIKEYVDLKKYYESKNEYRAFFLNNQLLSLARNSNQPETCRPVPLDFVKKFNNMPSKYYTVDFAELSDGKWIVIETGDGQVSGLSPDQLVFKYFDDIYRILLD